jgi:hypothetical protein
VIAAPKTPECDKLAELRKESGAIMEFMAWLASEKRLVFATFDEDSALVPAMRSIEDLLREYEDAAIDKNKLETERRALLDYQRQLNFIASKR